MKERLWTKNFTLLVLITLFSFVVRQMAMSTFPMMVEWAGGSNSVAGALTLLLTAASIVVRLFSGPLTDRFGRRAFMVLGAIIFAFSTVMIAVFPNLYVIAVMQLFFGAGLSCITTASGAAVVDVAPASRLGEGLGFYTLGNSVAMAIGPAMGLYLIGLGDGKSYRLLYVFATAVLVFTAFMGAAVSYKAPKRERIRLSFREMIEPSTLPAAFLQFLAIFSFTSVISYIATYAAEAGIGNIGSFFTVYAIGMILIRLVIGRIVDKGKECQVVMASMIVMAAAFLGIVFASSLAELMILALVLGFGQGAVMPTLQNAAMKHVTPERRGAGNATYQLFSDIGTGIGAAVWGVVADNMGFSAIYVGAFAICFIGTFLTAALLGGKRKNINNAKEVGSV